MVQDPIQITRQTYDQIAGQFAAQTANLDERLIGRMSRLVENIPSGERILDLGCGTGRDLGWFLEKSVNAIGGDLSLGMLMEARRAHRFTLCQIEMRQLAFASGSFMGVWCNAALLHLPKEAVPNALAEIYRVLIPGGRFFLSVQKGDREGLEISQNEKVVRFFARYVPQEMEQFLEQAGFSIKLMEEYEFGRPWIWFETVRSCGI